MIGVQVSVPIACFRKGMAREYLETEELPPPATCYGFLLSLVGETDRRRHCGARVTCSMIKESPRRSTVLRTVWRVKSRRLGSADNTRPDYQQLLTGVELVIWLDSSEEIGEGELLETRVLMALDPGHRDKVDRFGGLSLGESTHMVDDVRRFEFDRTRQGQLFQLAERGRLTLPVWVDHVGSARTRYATGELVRTSLEPPERELMPRIMPPDGT